VGRKALPFALIHGGWPGWVAFWHNFPPLGIEVGTVLRPCSDSSHVTAPFKLSFCYYCIIIIKMGLGT